MTDPRTICQGAHCKCMNLDGKCENHHYSTCVVHNPKAMSNTPSECCDLSKGNVLRLDQDSRCVVCGRNVMQPTRRTPEEGAKLVDEAREVIDQMKGLDTVVGWEGELYATWKAEHPDVKHGDTPHEWWVRNYVETRLLPKITTLLNSKRETLEKGLDSIKYTDDYDDAVIEFDEALKLLKEVMG